MPNKKTFRVTVLVGEQINEKEYLIMNYQTNTADEKIAKTVYANHFTSHQHIKDDLIQCAIIALWQSRNAYRNKSLLSTYLYKVAKKAM